jgi:hypothetical protein
MYQSIWSSTNTVLYLKHLPGSLSILVKHTMEAQQYTLHHENDNSRNESIKS